MKTLIANFILPLLGFTVASIIMGLPEGMHPNTRLILPLSLTMIAYGFSLIHDGIK